MTAQPIRTCTVCSLLCPLDAAFDASQYVPCQLRTNWLTERSRPQRTRPDNLANCIEALQTKIQSAKRPLFWVDGADVETMRGVVKLAEDWNATIVVPKQAGATHISNITCNDGWFGTTLADAAVHSHLVVALGTNWITHLPKLKQRFFSQRKDQVWWQIADGDPPSDSAIPFDAKRVSIWPRNSWYSQVCDLVQQIAGSKECGEDGLAKQILSSDYTTILWEKSELAESSDEFLIYQLHQLARLRTQKARCSLLPLDSNVGTETASAVLLWLTGCSEIAQYRESTWTSPSRYQNFDTNDWQTEFDFIVQIVNTASRSDVSITAHLHICQTESQLTSSKSIESAESKRPLATIYVGVAGVDHDAILFRGDHGLTSFAPAAEAAILTNQSVRASSEGDAQSKSPAGPDSLAGPESHAGSSSGTIRAAQVLMAIRSLIKGKGGQ